MSWSTQRFVFFGLFNSFCSYIRVCFQLDAFVREHNGIFNETWTHSCLQFEWFSVVNGFFLMMVGPFFFLVCVTLSLFCRSFTFDIWYVCVCVCARARVCVLVCLCVVVVSDFSYNFFFTVYVWMCLEMLLCVYIYICIYTLNIYIYIYICVCVCVCVCLCACVCVCLFPFVCVCMIFVLFNFCLYSSIKFLSFIWSSV